MGRRPRHEGTDQDCAGRIASTRRKGGKPRTDQPRRHSTILNRFEHVYGHLGKTDAILGTAPGHHRLLWIHPFLDGNGRVARLMSHAVLLETLDTGAVWSAARGLARKVAEYKRHLAACDSPRRNDLDGRGALSDEALAAFTKFFLEVCVDQVEFMEGLMQPDALRARILLWAEEQIKLSKLPPSSGRVLEAVLYAWELAAQWGSQRRRCINTYGHTHCFGIDGSRRSHFRYPLCAGPSCFSRRPRGTMDAWTFP